MTNRAKRDKPDPHIIERLRYSYEPMDAELSEDMRVDAALDELMRAVL
ncbi:MAG: hypothetical protein OXH83_02745 [Bryobacterales bacterium]|nr:hypothetical protein [Bryobacterales bacterium]